MEINGAEISEIISNAKGTVGTKVIVKPELVEASVAKTVPKVTRLEPEVIFEKV